MRKPERLSSRRERWANPVTDHVTDPVFFDALAAEIPCLGVHFPPGGAKLCVARWVLSEDVVAWCPPVAHAVLGPCWTVEVLHAPTCARAPK